MFLSTANSHWFPSASQLSPVSSTRQNIRKLPYSLSEHAAGNNTTER